jgi:outer membrane protein assembly factor BamB
MRRPATLALALLATAFATVGCSAFRSQPPPPLTSPGRVYSQAWGQEPLYVIDAQSGERVGLLAFDGWVGTSLVGSEAVYVVGAHEVRATRIRDSKSLARYEHDGARLQPVLAHDPDSVFVMQTPAPGEQEQIIALKRSDLSVRWAKELQSDVRWRMPHSAPVVAAGYLLVPAGDRLLAVDRADGGVAWTYRAAHNLSWPLAIGATVFVSGDDGSLHAIDAEHGELLYAKTYPPRGGSEHDWNERAITASAELVMVRSQSRLLAIDPGSGATRFRLEGLEAAVVGDRLVFAASRDGRYAAYDARDGRLRWSLKPEERIRSAPVLAEDDALVLVRPGGDELLALDGASGLVRWRFDLDDGEPVVALAR